MSTPKGWPTQAKDDRLKQEFTTIQPVAPNQHAMDVIAHIAVEEIAADAAEAGSTTTAIAATGHVALVGDQIRFTSGALSGRTARVVLESDQTSMPANEIPLAETLPSAPGAGDTFQILRNRPVTATSSGALGIALTDPIRYRLDGTATEVAKDTSVAANTRALPVEIHGASGVEINITAGDINVQTSHTGANPDSVRIGDGTETANVSASNELQVRDDDANTALTSLDGKLPAQGAALTAASTPVNIASDQTVPVSASSLPLPTGAATEASLSTVAGAVSGTEMQVDVVAPLPAGTNNIGDVDILTLPDVTQSTHDDLNANANIQVGNADVANGNPVPISDAGGSVTVDNASMDTIAGAVSGSEMQVDIVSSALPTGSATEAKQDVIIAELDLDIIDTAFIDYSSSNLPGNATNPLELVTSLSADVKAIQVFDEAGFPCEIMTGAAASEVRKLLFGSGTNETVRARITSGTRVSVRRLDDAASVTTGFITVNFLG